MTTTVAPTIDYPTGDRRIVRITWAAMKNGNVGVPVTLTNWADRTIQATGTFGAGGSVTVKGSNDETNFVAMSDPQGSALTFTAAGMKLCSEVPLTWRPEVTAGDETTSLTITAVVRTPSAIITRS